MNTLTHKQLAEIVFQRRERLTNGVLKDLSIPEKFSHRFMRYTRPEFDKADATVFDTWRLKLMMEFNQSHPIENPHPRSLWNAMRELKAIGYNNTQIKQINYTLSVFIANTLHNNHSAFGRAFDYSVASGDNDDCFLGRVALKRFDQAKSKKEIFAQAAYHDNPKNNGNSIIKDAAVEQIAFQEFVQWLEETAVSHGVSLSPAKPQKRRIL